MAETTTNQPAVDFRTEPARYKHWRLAFDGPVATLTMDVQEDGGLRPGYELKLNSYDLGVDIELYDALQRLRFEHPEVGAVILTSGKERVFCAGANIRMLGQSSHAWKVNFCKFTNETRNAIEEASSESKQVWLTAVNGPCAGGGYELALATEWIVMADDGNTAVSLPEVPMLAVLPGTGGLTRLVDKRKVRRDRADFFCTTEEGVKGKRAVEWSLVDEVVPRSRHDLVHEAQLDRALALDAFLGRAEEVGAVAADFPLVHQPGEAARARKHSEQRHLGQRHGRVAVVGHHDPLGGQRQFVAAAGARAVDRGQPDLPGLRGGFLHGVARLVGELAEVHLEAVAGLAEHADVGARAEDALLAGGQEDRAHLRVLEAQPLERVVQLDVHAEVVGVELQLVAGSQAAVLLHVHRERRHRPVEGEPPVLVARGLGAEVHRGLVRRRLSHGLSQDDPEDPGLLRSEVFPAVRRAAVEQRAVAALQRLPVAVVVQRHRAVQHV